MLPDTFNGLPLHSLTVHATVVLVPLAGLLGVLFAIPRSRGWATIPLPLVAAGAALSTWVSIQTGEALQDAGGRNAAGLDGPLADLIDQHAELADQLQVMVIVYAGVAILAAVVALAKRGSGAVLTALGVLLVLGAVVISIQTYRVGDLGAQAVWNPTGDVDYGAADD